jgi:hypothetical protein
MLRWDDDAPGKPLKGEVLVRHKAIRLTLSTFTIEQSFIIYQTFQIVDPPVRLQPFSTDPVRFWS